MTENIPVKYKDAFPHFHLTKLSKCAILLIVLQTGVILLDIQKSIRTIAEQGGGVIRTADVQAAGISRTMLSKLEQSGYIERVARGQYILAEAFPDELYLWQCRRSDLVYSHETALYLLDMAERVPLQYSATLPNNKRLSSVFPSDFKLYYVKPELHDLGVVALPTKFGHEVNAYNAERTICDVLRSRRRIDDQTVAAAIKNYAMRPKKDFMALGEMAQVFRVTAQLQTYLEVLL